MNKNVKNLRGFEVKYLGATNTKGSRMKLTDLRFNKSKYVYRSYNYMNGKQDCIDYLNKIGIKVLFSCESKNNTDILLSDNFEVQLR